LGRGAAGTLTYRAILSFSLLLAVPSLGLAQAPAPVCSAPSEALALEHAPDLVHLRIARKQPIKIVAIGSSSTSGAGATSDAATYPSQLEAALKAALPGIPITVLNKGIGGEEAAQMVARFDADVIDENPDLVIWQVGSNSVLRDHPTPGEVIRDGVDRLKASGADVILMNPQYAPKILAKPDVGHALDVITATGRDAEVGVFNRFAVMRHWRETLNIPFETSLSPDGLHMNDWSYACVAQLLAGAILEGTRPPPAATATAHAPKR
jgi:hypothetical protein